MRRPLVLASSSAHRRSLLARLRLPFTVAQPAVDETRHAGEAPSRLVERLARAKAQAVASGHPGSLIIGSDQVAVCAGVVLNKPGDFETARRQLRAQSGRRVEFLTGLCLLNAATGRAQIDCVPYRVWVRELATTTSTLTCTPRRPTTAPGVCARRGWGSRS